MELREEYPPNYSEITRNLNLEGHKPVFCYGKYIYNPHKLKISPFTYAHEKVHSEQQGDNPEKWWNEYLINPKFRLEQELLAMAKEYSLVKLVLKDMSNDFLYIKAKELSSPLYALNLTIGQAESKIRNKAKGVV